MEFWLNLTVDVALVVGVYGVGLSRLDGVKGALSGIPEALRDYPVDRLESLEASHAEFVGALVELDAKVDKLPHTWEEMHHKVRRTEERTRGAVRRAMEELEENGLESAELNEIGSQLRLGDGNGSGPNGMHPMSTQVGGIPPGAQQPQVDGRQAAIAYKWSRTR